MSKIYFVVGVNGVGKSTLIPLLRSRLNAHGFEVYDFDERGVPTGAGSEWRLSETLHWAEVGMLNLEKDVSTIICGYVKAKEIEEVEKQMQIEIGVCLLDASPEVIEKRLTNRHTDSNSLSEMERITGKTSQKFIEDNIWVSEKFREEAGRLGYKIIDTSELTPEQVADQIVGWF